MSTASNGPTEGYALARALAAATAHQAEHGLDGARLTAEQAVHLDFADAEAHWVLARILEQAGDLAAAHTEYLLAMHLGWEDAALDAAIERTVTASPEPSDGLSLDERRYRQAITRAINCLENRDLEQARHYARTAVTLDPARPEGFNLLGVLAELAGRRVDAHTHYRVASELAPGYRPAAENLARSVRPWTERGRPVW
jgi:Flp pilus assembly protein TadD